MKTLIIDISDDAFGKLTAAANVLEMPIEQLAAESCETWIDQMDDNLAHIEVSARVWDTLEQLRRVTEKADAHDERNRSWRFYQTPDGKFRAEYSHHFHADRINEGCVVVN